MKGFSFFNLLKNILKYCFFPIFWLLKKARDKYLVYLRIHNPKKLASYYYWSAMNKKLDWKNPVDINEKINWLKFYGDRSLWARLADKYKVREYVCQCGYDEMLVKLYGKWDDVDSINWEVLPDKFILKLNTGSGGNFICTSKEKFDKIKVSEDLRQLMLTEYSDLFVEPHYSDIKPCIIAEELLDVTKQDIPSSSLVDYKVWAFNGEPLYIWVCYNRTPNSVEVATYDTDWNFRPEKSVYGDIFKKSSVRLPKPNCLEYMLKAASQLSIGHPQVRVDFYVVDNKCYFGEMTFTALGGYINYYSPEMLYEMGQKTDLSILSHDRKYQ